MRALLCVDGSGVEALVEQAFTYVGQSADWCALHVLDTRGQMDLSVLRRSMPGTGPLGPRQRQAIEAAGSDHAQAVLNQVGAAFAARNLALTKMFQAEGEPGREICRVAEREQIGLVVLRARRRPGAAVGPASVGHTARFVLDHAPCPVLLLRGAKAVA